MSSDIPRLGRLTSGLQALPLETWNHIIASLGGPHPQEDVLAEHHMDINSLRACSLTCRSWRRAAQGHLFYFLSITVTNATCEEKVSSVAEILPSIGAYVLAFAVSVSGPESRRFDQQADVLAHFRAIAPMLPRVETLSMNAIDLKAPTGDLSPFPAVFPALQSLYIADVPHDLRLLHVYVAACKQIRNLTLLGSITGFQSFLMVLRASRGTIIHVQPSPSVVLETHLASVLAWLTPANSTITTEFDDLEASCTTAVDQHALASFIKHQAVHLKHLDVGFYLKRLKKGAAHDIHSYAPFASKHIVSLNIRFPEAPYDAAKLAIVQLLDHIDMPALETLSIVYAVRNVAPRFVAAQPTYDLTRLPALKKVEVTICDAKPGLTEIRKKAMSTAIPFLAAADKRGILEVTVYDQF